MLTYDTPMPGIYSEAMWGEHGKGTIRGPAAKKWRSSGIQQRKAQGPTWEPLTVNTVTYSRAAVFA
jgi:hypothetical protein